MVYQLYEGFSCILHCNQKSRETRLLRLIHHRFKKAVKTWACRPEYMQYTTFPDLPVRAITILIIDSLHS